LKTKNIDRILRCLEMARIVNNLSRKYSTRLDGAYVIGHINSAIWWSRQ